MKNGLFEKRIPTIFALIILLGGLVVTSFLVKQGLFTSSHATPNEEPQNIEVTNITDTSFTVVFTTLDPTVAGITILNGTTPTVYYDTRNPQGGKPYVSHFITVGNLLPKTTYSFNVLSNGVAYLDNGKNFTATTINLHIPVSSSSYSLSGNILLPDGTAGSDVLVLAAIPESQTVSAITNDLGVYVIPTSLIVNPSNGHAITLIPNTKIKLTAIKSALLSQINYSYEPGVNIPTVSLSNNYSFTAGQEISSVGTPSSNLSIPNSPRKTEVKITIPKPNQSFTDQRPLFQGTATPNSLVTIIIHSDTVNVGIRADPNGNWAYRTSIALSAGTHTITISAKDAFGILKTATTTFTVFASGSQIAESATPSATLAPSVTPTLEPSITPESIVPTSISPTATLIPTATPTIIITPTDTPTPTAAVVVPPKTQVPPTGNTTQAIFLTTISILFIVSGSVLLFIL